jgi:cobalt-zinc-cadmium efflux system outer membrane protein
VNADVQSRFGHSIGNGGGLETGTIPPGVVVEDGLTSDEVVALTLWNNAAYHELLAQLDVSAAQLYDAGLITDPQFSILFPLGPKQFELTAFQAIDALWLRPVRERAAELDLCQLSEQMVQNGLNTIRDVRVAHANLLLAQERAELTREARTLRDEIADLADKRLAAGDISELEANTTRIEALQAAAVAAGAEQDVLLAQQRLRGLLGVSVEARDLVAANDSPAGIPTEQLDTLVETAFAMRPDLRAAEIRYAAATERVEVAASRFMTLDAIFDANGSGTSGFEAGPGVRMTLPIFNGNDGGIAIAEAQAEQAVRQFSTIRDQIDLDVRTAFTQLQQATEQRQLTDQKILPALATAEELSRRNYENGGVPYFLVLQTTTQFVDAKLRRADASANIRRAVAELERSVGRKVELQETATSDEPMILPLDPETPSDADAESTTQPEVEAEPVKDAPELPQPEARAPLRRRISESVERARF